MEIERASTPVASIPSSGPPADVAGPRFRVMRPLGEGGMGAVFEAFDTERGHTVALKMLKSVDSASILRLKQEFRALADLTHPSLVGLYELVCQDGAWFFTMELVDGVDLRSWVWGASRDRSDPEPQTITAEVEASVLESGSDAKGATAGATAPKTAGPTRSVMAGEPANVTRAAEREAASLSTVVRVQPEVPERPLPTPAQLERLLPAFHQLAQALRALHQSGHLHRDVKASNVLVTAEGRVVLLDFGIVAHFGARAEEIEAAGTVPYMAPEQFHAGSPCSPASDWYAFGVVLYEALTGMRPFNGSARLVAEAKQRMEVIPIDALVLGVPRDLIDLTTQLLAKDPGQRPNGETILRQLSGNMPARLAPLSSRSDLVGRDRELAALIAAHATADTGRGSTVLLGGASGMGKSALVGALLEQLTSREATMVLTGRCYERESVPYKALDSVVDALARTLRRLGAERTAAWLPDDLAPLGRVFPVTQQVEAIRVAVERGQASLATTELQRRAFDSMHQLLERIAQDVTLVIFIDDLQWGDNESLPLLKELLRPSDSRRLFLGSYRSEELQSSAVLRAIREHLATLESDGKERILELELGPIPREGIRTILTSQLGTSVSPADLAATVDEARGSPYFAHELGRYLAKKGQVEGAGFATLDEVLWSRVQELSREARNLLTVISVAGWRLPNHTMEVAAGLRTAQQPALRELQVGHFVRSSGVRLEDTVEPYHDRVREAILSHLPKEAEQSIHLQIAQALDQPTRRREQDTYALAHHYFHAASPAFAPRTFELNVEAGKLAAAAHAHEQAYAYLEHARKVAEIADLEQPQPLLQLRADVALMAGHVERAVEIYNSGLNRAEDALGRAGFRMGLAHVGMALQDIDETAEAIKLALAELHQPTPKKSPLGLIPAYFGFRRGRKLLAQPRDQVAATSKDLELARATVRGYHLLTYATYFQLNSLEMLQAVLLTAPHVALLGPSRELAGWHGAVAVSSAVLGKREWALRNAARAAAVAQEIGDPLALARARQYNAFALNILGEVHEAERNMRECLETFEKILENLDFLSAVGDYAWANATRGHATAGWHWLERGLHRIQAGKKGSPLEAHTIRCYAATLLAQRGFHEEGCRHLAEFKQLVDRAPPEAWRSASYHAHCASVALETQDLGARFEEAVQSFQAMGLSPGRIPIQLRIFYIMQAWGRVQQLAASGTTDARARAKKALCELRAAGTRHPTLAAHGHAAQGSFLSSLGRLDEASSALDQAQSLAERFDNPWVLFLVAKERARLAEGRGQTDQAAAELKKAKELALVKGWTRRLEQLPAS